MTTEHGAMDPQSTAATATATAVDCAFPERHHGWWHYDEATRAYGCPRCAPSDAETRRLRAVLWGARGTPAAAAADRAERAALVTALLDWGARQRPTPFPPVAVARGEWGVYVWLRGGEAAWRTFVAGAPRAMLALAAAVLGIITAAGVEAQGDPSRSLGTPVAAAMAARDRAWREGEEGEEGDGDYTEEEETTHGQ